MSRVLIWDLPMRVAHWGLAGSLTLALGLGLAVDDDHPLFAYHALFGVIAGGFLAMRLILAIVGSRHARFSSLVLQPKELLRYALGMLRGRAQRYDSHNPGTSWMSVLLWGLVPVLLVTGLSPSGIREEIHEWAAYGVLGLIGFHLAGLALHSLRHREPIAWAMIDGRKEASASSALESSGRWSGLVLAALAAIGLVSVFRGFDARSGRLRLPGLTSSVELMPDRHGDRDPRAEEHRRDHE